MDKTDIIKIAITAAVTVVAKELLTFMAKHSKTVAVALAKNASSFLKNHWRILSVLVDFCASGVCVWMMYSFLSVHHVVASRAFAAGMAMCSFVAITSILSGRQTLEEYAEELKKRRAHKQMPEPATASGRGSSQSLGQDQ